MSVGFIAWRREGKTSICAVISVTTIGYPSHARLEENLAPICFHDSGEPTVRLDDVVRKNELVIRVGPPKKPLPAK
jgi:hypothetical protein